jgi:hypothetical protein
MSEAAARAALYITGHGPTSNKAIARIVDELNEALRNEYEARRREAIAEKQQTPRRPPAITVDAVKHLLKRWRGVSASGSAAKRAKPMKAKAKHQTP